MAPTGDVPHASNVWAVELVESKGDEGATVTHRVTSCLLAMTSSSRSDGALSNNVLSLPVRPQHQRQHVVPVAYRRRRVGSSRQAHLVLIPLLGTPSIATPPAPLAPLLWQPSPSHTGLSPGAVECSERVHRPIVPAPTARATLRILARQRTQCSRDVVPVVASSACSTHAW